MSQEVITAFLLGVSVGQWWIIRQMIDALKDLLNKRKRRK